MAERQWTAQQLKAIEADGTLTVLSAAAGSGKTTVLVEKALRILLDEENKTPADRLLIVTFSNASAKEFKNRIEKGINNAIKLNPENAYIKSQKIALQNADISTIHSFCIKLTRENFQALDISADFTICDDAKALLIHQKAVDAAMEYGYTLQDFSDFVTLFGKSSQDKQVREFLQYMYYYFSALPFPQKRAQQLCTLAQSGSFKDSEVYKYLWKDLGQQVEYAVYLVNRMKQLMETGGAEGYSDGVKRAESAVKRLTAAYESGDVFAVKSIASEKMLPLGRVAKGGANVYSEAVKGANKLLGDTLKSIAQDTEYLDEERYAQDLKQTGRYIDALTKVFIFYSQKLMEIKKREKTFEFSDFEHFAVQLLLDENGGRTPLAKALSEKYVKIMEDEFQDTSFVQDMIFKTIAHDEESNLFVVGDVKQSIYGFRKASPQILLEKRSRGIADSTKGNTIVLPNNFRSEVNIIRGINCLFEKIMTAGLGGVDYKYGEQLLPAPNKTDSRKAGIDLLVARDNEAQTVAKKIFTMVKNGYLINDGGTERAVGYGDFCILLRNKNRFDEFADALGEYGIKAFVRDDKPLLLHEEVQGIIALLKVINNPLQEVYLTAGMFGDLFDFTLDEIFEIKLINTKENLYKLLAQSESPKSAAFLQLLKQLGFAAKVYSPDKLIDSIVNITGYYTRLSFSGRGAQKRENIRRFILFAKNYITGHQNNLTDFLRYIDLCVESGKGQGENMHQPPDTVAIMTMHTSKGLEFPVCFVSGLGTAFNKTDRSNRLMIDPQLGMATYANESFGYNRSTAGIHAIKKKVLAANADDEMRLLYVALTRAKNKLFLTAQYTNMFTEKSFEKIWQKNSQAPSEYALRKANTPIEWVLTAFVDCPQIFGEYIDSEFFDANAVCGSDVCENAGAGGGNTAVSESGAALVHFAFVDENGDEINPDGQVNADNAQGGEDKPAQPAPEQKYIDFDADSARDVLDFEYPDLVRTRLPIKVSVGEIAKAPVAAKLKRPQFARQSYVSAAEKGTQMHRFAQYCDILLARMDLRQEIDRLANSNLVDKNLLNPKQLEKFIYSDVAQIVLNGQKIYNEKEFLVPYSAQKALGGEEYRGETVMIQGVIDCLVINGDEAYVIDYKTDRVQNMAQLCEKYTAQLEMYRYAAMQLYDVHSVKCIIYSFYLDDSVTF